MFLSKNLCRRALLPLAWPSWGLHQSEFARCLVNTNHNGFCTAEYPEKPKRPIPAFLSFVKCTKEELEKKNIHFQQPQDLVKQCSILWRELPEEQRNAWLKDASDRQEKYRRKCEEYKSSLSAHQRFQMKQDSRKRVKDRIQIQKELHLAGKPLKPSPVMALFSKTIQKSKDAKENQGFLNIINQWKSLSEEEKQVYSDIRRVQWNEYVKASKEWKSDPKNVTIVKRIQKVHRKGLSPQTVAKMKLDMLGRPKKPQNSFIVFRREKFKEKMVGKEDVIEEWKKLSDEEKKVYTDASNFEREKYKTKYEEWMKRMEDEGKITVVEELLATIKTKQK